MLRSPRVSPLLVVLALAACSAVSPGGAAPPPSPTYPDVSGAWSGRVVVDGQPIDASLELMQDRDELSATLAAPVMGISASGSGAISPDGEVRIVLEYDLECPGTAELSGTRGEDGSALAGTLRASDCTGQTSGSFEFRR